MILYPLKTLIIKKFKEIYRDGFPWEILLILEWTAHPLQKSSPAS